MQQEKNILVNRGIPRSPSSSFGFGFSGGGTPNHTHWDRAYDAVDHAVAWLMDSNDATEKSFQENIQNIIYITDTELAKTRAAVSAVVPPGTDALDIESRTLKLQIFKARKDHQEHVAIANLYYGHDPLTHRAQDTRLQGFEFIGRRGGHIAYYNAIAKWNVSYAAAYEAKFLAEQIKIMDGRLVSLDHAIAEAKARAAAAADAAQARAQAEANRVAEEQTRKAAEAEAEAKRAIEEQAQRARIAATVSAKQGMEAANALWEAERNAEIAEQDAAEARRQKEVQKAREPARATRTFPVSGSAAAAGPVFTIAGGTLAPNLATASGITKTLRVAVSAVIETEAATALPVVAAFAALSDPSELGNRERYALSVPLSELAPANTGELMAVAASQGEINLPIVLGSKTTDDAMVFVVASSKGTSIPSNVPVRLAALAPHSNVYKSYSPDGSSTLMTWTPIVKETDASPASASSVPNIVLHEGASPWDTTRWVKKDPELKDYDFGSGFVTVFPLESGIAPIYTVFNNPYEWVVAEEARKAAEAEILRVAQAQALTGRAYPIPGTAAAVGPVFTLVGSSLAISPETTLAIQAALRAAVAMAIESLTAIAAPTLAGFAALLYSPKLANGELPERYAFSTPLSELAPTQHHDFQAIAAADGTIDLPVRLTSQAAADGRSEILVISTDGVTHPSKVRVVPVSYNAQQNLYTATTEETSPRTLAWTPIIQPGNSSTTLPVELPDPPVYTGASVTPIAGRIDPFPEITENSFDDYVFVFPIDSGLPPLYVMFRDRREDPGVALGSGTPVSEVWSDAASKGQGVPIPLQIADQLRGRAFRNFRKFREAFWKAVANDPNLAQQFDPGSLAHMRKGYGAFVKKIDRVGARIKYELHHKKYISLGGEVYNLDNIIVMTPKRHIQTHQENNK
ncbi:S-type pyocin domain-containing protein [Pseudomonas sp. P97.38]|uniref:S-type pyocin domain-containing protein n=1 Tax=Pseudomonas sp. P97.38 TaxID=255451 RepID=UPI00069DDB1A|nr:S-type pyocin domain-containing protein [Pseudomonas sp. P97.38]